LADTDLLEFVCAENEKDRTHLVGKHSDDAKKAVKVAPEILAKFTGTYLLGETSQSSSAPNSFHSPSRWRRAH
jgi:hypothetical protein